MARQADDRARRRLILVDNGDGTYSYQGPAGLEPGALRRSGAFTWRYVRQEVYSWNPEPITGSVTVLRGPPKSGDRIERLLGSWYSDGDGALWVLDAVDEAALTPLDSMGYEPVDDILTDTGVSPHVASTEDDDEGEWVTWTPMSWTDLDCIPGSPDEVHIWDGESRTAITSGFTDRQKTAVRVVNTQIGYNCSGVMLRDRWVITAAHCVYNNSGDVAKLANLQVRIDWAGETQGVDKRFIAPSGFNWPTDTDDDFVLLKLQHTWNATEPKMNLSQAGDSVLQAVGANFHNLGFPGWFPGCSSANSLDLVHSSDNDVTGFFNQRLRWRGDGTVGQSGGPLYYCPSGDDSVCGSGEDGYVVAVFSGWNPVWQRFVGPRSSDFYTWAMDTMDNN